MNKERVALSLSASTDSVYICCVGLSSSLMTLLFVQEVVKAPMASHAPINLQKFF
jgi:hypothetical protein